MHMDVWVAVVGLVGVVGAAAISRWPALTSEGRLRESIARDVALWRELPQGSARDDFAVHIAERVQALQGKRGEESDKLQTAWAVATSVMAVAYVLILAASGIGGSPHWLDSVVFLLQIVGIATALGGFVIAGVALWLSVKAGFVLLKARWAGGAASTQPAAAGSQAP